MMAVELTRAFRRHLPDARSLIEACRSRWKNGWSRAGWTSPCCNPPCRRRSCVRSGCARRNCC
jgi:hypothetical protein